MAESKKSGQSQSSNGQLAPWSTEEAVRFVAAYNAASSQQAAATALGIKLSTVQARARYCRKEGIALKEFGRRGPINWDAVRATMQPTTT